MNRIRYTLSFLLIAGVACVHAQQPIVKINSNTPAVECDVAAPAGAPIFQLDATGNVLVSGTMSGPGCASTGGTNTPTFGLSPPASGVVINGGSTTVAADSGASVPFTYQAYYTTGCSVGTPTTTGTCPAVTASNGTCTPNAANSNSCAPTGATLSIPTGASMGTNTSCAYSVKATCLPGSVTSTATLTVTAPSGGGDPACTGLASVKTSSGANWVRVTGNTSVKYGDGATAAKDATDYVSIWSYPGSTVPWPGNSGLSTRPTAMTNYYFAEKFTVPTDGSVPGHPNWSWSGSGINSNASIAISACPGDFGQTGTLVTTGCKVNQTNSSSGLTSVVSATQVGSFCSLVPGKSYYLNILPMANLPVSNVSTSTCSNNTCTPWLGQTH
jgi:hypothetical protein